MIKTLQWTVLFCITLILLSCGTDFDRGPSGIDCFDRDYLKSAGMKTSYLETVVMKIDHFKPSGFSGIYSDPVLLYRVQENEGIGSENWMGRAYGFSIRNFDFEWGYSYELIVERREIEYSATVMDAPGTCHILVNLVSREKADPGALFDIQLLWLDEYSDQSNFFSTVKGDLQTGFTLYESINIYCGDLCDNLAEQLQIEQNLTGVFQHTFDGAIKLVDLK